jgi:D-alanyl-D-alanine carboxypeptidase
VSRPLRPRDALGLLLITAGWLSLVAVSGQAVAEAWPGSGVTVGSGRRLNTSLRTARVRLHAPGAQAAVARCGRLEWAGASGFDTSHRRRRVTDRTLFMLASTTKSVTATLVMQLVDEGRLSLDTPLSTFYPLLPNAPSITVRMLLGHTSGLPDYLEDPGLSSLIDRRPRHHWRRDEVLAVLHHAQFSPGQRYAYSNSNYVVLGGIVEKVARDSIEHRYQVRIARPAGMSRSTFAYRPGRLAEFARPYQEGPQNSLIDRSTPGLGLGADYWGPVWTDGGLASTATDLARFSSALMGGRLTSSASLAAMTTLGRGQYGLGLYALNYDGHVWVGHDGTYGGYESESWTDRTRGVTVAVTIDIRERDSAPDTASSALWRSVVRAYDRVGDRSRTCGALTH